MRVDWVLTTCLLENSTVPEHWMQSDACLLGPVSAMSELVPAWGLCQLKILSLVTQGPTPAMGKSVSFSPCPELSGSIWAEAG